MTERVPADQIEQIVGTFRHATRHIARAVKQEQTVYILHSHACLHFHEDLDQCRFARALGNGIDLNIWEEFQDRPVFVEAFADVRLIPVRDAVKD